MGNDTTGPVDRREVDAIWKRIDDLVGSVENYRKEARENFQIVFSKIDAIRVSMSCAAHSARMDALENRIVRAEQVANGIKANQGKFLSTALSNIHYFVSAAALIIAGISWIAK